MFIDGSECLLFIKENLMTVQEKKEEIKFIIGRFDHYYDSVNNKGNLYLAVNTFILGGVLSGYLSLDAKCHFGNEVLLMLVIALGLNLVSFYFTLKAVNPFLSRKQNTPSMLYFGDVSNASEAYTIEYWENISDMTLLDDLIMQYRILAAGLFTKFKWLQKATGFIALEIAVIIFSGILLFIIY